MFYFQLFVDQGSGFPLCFFSLFHDTFCDLYKKMLSWFHLISGITRLLDGGGGNEMLDQGGKTGLQLAFALFF